MGSTTVGRADTTFSRKGEVDEQASSSSGPSTKIMVYVSYRGLDLDKTFVSQLGVALHLVCNPFLEEGDASKSKSIDEALNGAGLLLGIFTRKYAKSAHCLNQLCNMLGSGKPLIPVFYNVNKTSLLSSLATAFRTKIDRKTDVERWRAGLMEAAAKTNLIKLKDCDNPKNQLIHEIVEAVSEELLKRPPHHVGLEEPHHVGLEETSKSVRDMLEEMSNAKVGVVGICGMAGIGKTTLALDVFNRENNKKYGSCCFLGAVKEAKRVFDVKEAKGDSVMDLQMQVLKDLAPEFDLKNVIKDVAEKKTKWDYPRCFDEISKRGKKVLLLVDGISERQQFDELVPNLKGLPAGSRVLITSQESGVLKSIMSDVKIESELYFVEELNYDESLNLFLWRAFKESNIKSVDPEFHGLIEDITKACSGLPITLEGMGKYLSDKKNLPADESDWRDAMARAERNALETREKKALETNENYAWVKAASEKKKKKALLKWYLSLDETERKAWDEFMKAVREEEKALGYYSIALEDYFIASGDYDEKKDRRKKELDERQREMYGRMEALDGHEMAWNEKNLWDEKTKALGGYEKVCKKEKIWDERKKALDEYEKEKGLFGFGHTLDSFLSPPWFTTETRRDEYMKKLRMQANDGMWRKENQPNKISWEHISVFWDSVFWNSVFWE